ncbi:MAG: hypothetical protein AAFY72_16570 [Cyanobacteria bacterium J06649_4]
MQSPLSDTDLSRSLQASPFYTPRGQQAKGDRSSWLRRVGTAIVDFLTNQPQLSVRVKTLPNGQQQWIAYDPEQDIRRTFDSQQAVRVWLEQRYYQ